MHSNETAIIANTLGYGMAYLGDTIHTPTYSCKRDISCKVLCKGDKKQRLSK
jgi:hypothetical protein